MQGWADVAVHAERDRDGRVAEALLDDAWVDAALYESNVDGRTVCSIAFDQSEK